jgi:hypothetical protein
MPQAEDDSEQHQTGHQHRTDDSPNRPVTGHDRFLPHHVQGCDPPLPPTPQEDGDSTSDMEADRYYNLWAVGTTLHRTATHTRGSTTHRSCRPGRGWRNRKHNGMVGWRVVVWGPLTLPRQPYPRPVHFQPRLRCLVWTPGVRFAAPRWPPCSRSW